jgi:hypothetical protein
MMLSRLLFPLTLFALILRLAKKTNSGQQKINAHAKRNETDDQETSSKEISLITSDPQPSGHAIHTEKDERNAKEELYWSRQIFIQRVATFIAFAAVVAASIYAYIAQQQKVIMDSTFAETQLLSKEAKRANDMAAEGDRPWLSFTGVGYERYPPLPDRIIPISLRVQNFGRSPTRVVSCRAGFRIYKNFPKNPEYKMRERRYNFIIVPGRTVSICDLDAGPFSQEEINSVDIAKGIHFYAYGTVQYENLSNAKRLHYFKGCFDFGRGVVSFGLLDCPDYSDAN